jgi:hypothetical protein
MESKKEIRRITRIHFAGGHYGQTILAECNDGTIWKLGYYTEVPNWRWQKMPPIPQDDTIDG